MYGNDNPIHIEIGSGRGEFLTEISQQNPDINYLGIECKEKRIVTMLKKLDLEMHPNVRLMKARVNAEMIGQMPENSIERFYIFHPDPWPKRRHQKNRLIQPDFLEKMLTVLKAEGSVLISTDFKDYAMEIVNVFAQNDRFRSEYEKGFSRDPYPGHIVTYFETKLKKKGFAPYYMRFNKVKEIVAKPVNVSAYPEVIND